MPTRVFNLFKKVNPKAQVQLKMIYILQIYNVNTLYNVYRNVAIFI